jgi:hypothetical protein
VVRSMAVCAAVTERVFGEPVFDSPTGFKPWAVRLKFPCFSIYLDTLGHGEMLRSGDRSSAEGNRAGDVFPLEQVWMNTVSSLSFDELLTRAVGPRPPSREPLL